MSDRPDGWEKPEPKTAAAAPVKAEVKKPAPLYPFSEHERNLIKLCRSIGHGKIVIYLQEGQPVRIEENESIKSIKL